MKIRIGKQRLVPVTIAIDPEDHTQLRQLAMNYSGGSISRIIRELIHHPDFLSIVQSIDMTKRESYEKK